MQPPSSSSSSPLSSHYEVFGARCYAVPPLIILPYGENFLVGFGFSANREFIGEFSPSELTEFLRGDLPLPTRRGVAPQAAPLEELSLDIEL